jgi:hypothetical protein
VRWGASLITSVGIAVSAVVLSVAFRCVGSDGLAWQHVIAGDGVAYNAYLSSWLVHGTLDPPHAQPAHLSAAGDGHVIKCTAGTALMQAPFFFLAHVRTLMSDGPEDGRSLHYQLAIVLAGLFYLLLGLVMVRRSLLTLGFTEKIAALVLIILFFGTGLCWYAVMEPSMSHVYAFFSIAWFIRAVGMMANDGRRRHVAWAACAWGLVILVRPLNGLVILAVPLMTNAPMRTLHEWVRTIGVGPLVRSAFALVLVLAIQPMLWYVQSGTLWVRPYAGEGFHWSHPMLWQSLFGASKGLFFYWPLLLIALPALVGRFGRRWSSVLAGLGWFAALAYLNSAWWNWPFADSYGLRAYVDHLPVFAVLMAIALRWCIARIGRWVWLPILSLLALQCFQMWQYHAGILLPQSMDLEKYTYVFLRSAPQYRRVLGGCSEPPPYAPNGMRTLFEGSCDPLLPSAQWSEVAWESMSSTAVFHQLDRVDPNGVEFHFGPEDYPSGEVVFVEVNNVRVEEEPGASNGARVVCRISYADATVAEYTFALNNVPNPPAGRERKWSASFSLPGEPRVRSIQLFVRKKGSGTFWLGAPWVRLSCPVRP